MPKRNPQTVTFKGETYKRLAPTAAPQSVTYQGVSYHLAGLPEQEAPAAPIEVSADPLPQVAPPKVGLDVEVISDEAVHPWKAPGKKRGPKRQEKGLPSLSSEEDTPLTESVDYDIYVRLSQDDFLLLSSLEEAALGLLNDFLTRARSKKLTSGRAEVLASEEEVREAISALQSFVSADDAPEATMLHAQDMLSSWKRNYLAPDTPTSRTPPSYTNDLPRGTNVRTFNYKGARYVLVEGAEEEKKSPGEKLLEVISNEEFADIFSNISPSVSQSPLFQTRKFIDDLQSARKATDEAAMIANDKKNGMRMLTDIFQNSEESIKNLERLMNEDGLLESIIDHYTSAVAKFAGAAEIALAASKTAMNDAIRKGWTSKWAAKQQKATFKKQLLERSFGISPDEFIANYYNLPDGSTRKQKEQQDKAEG